MNEKMTAIEALKALRARTSDDTWREWLENSLNLTASMSAEKAEAELDYLVDEPVQTMLDRYASGHRYTSEHVAWDRLVDIAGILGVTLAEMGWEVVADPNDKEAD